MPSEYEWQVTETACRRAQLAARAASGAPCCCPAPQPLQSSWPAPLHPPPLHLCHPQPAHTCQPGLSTHTLVLPMHCSSLACTAPNDHMHRGPCSMRTCPSAAILCHWVRAAGYHCLHLLHLEPASRARGGCLAQNMLLLPLAPAQATKMSPTIRSSAAGVSAGAGGMPCSGC